LGECLNNVDFAKVPCDLLDSCIEAGMRRYRSPTFPYKFLKECTGAKPLPLSVRPSVKNGKLRAHIYPVSKTCWGIPLPLSFESGQCASTFAVSSKCGIAGSSIKWE
jgi:hypothetical protein